MYLDYLFIIITLNFVRKSVTKMTNNKIINKDIGDNKTLRS